MDRTIRVYEPGQQNYRTTHLEFAAWLSHRGHTLVDVEIERPGKAIYTLDTTEDQVRLAKLAWASSEACKFQDAMRLLKSLAYGEVTR